jgi:diguanylate cyclase (GGDEF)-like protein
MDWVNEETGTGVLLADSSQKVLSIGPEFTRISGLEEAAVYTMRSSEIVRLLQERSDEMSVRTIPLTDKEKVYQLDLIMVRQIGEQRRQDDIIRRLAFQDPLTHLPNRMCLNRCLQSVLTNMRKKDMLAAVLFLDLDRFKAINDTLGHAAGDELLKEAAHRLQNCLRKGDHISRLGGDEFICVLVNLTDQAEAEHLAKKIISRMTDPFLLQGKEFYVTASLGISVYPYHGDEGETLIANADAAMYRAKSEGRNKYKLFSYEMNALSFEKMLLEQSLRKAIQNDELLLHYQPQVDIETGQIIGVEALVRWMHPEFGLIAPSEFIPLAEEIGLICDLGYWIMLSACQQSKAWHESGLPPVVLSVNVSASQFQHHDFLSQVDTVLELSGLEPQWLQLEITESVLVQEVEQTVERLNELKRRGIQIAVDDFGTGYSSLSYLKKFSIDVLKIDRVFIRDIVHNSNDQAITNAVIRLAHDLNLKVVAEGVEFQEQLECIKTPQCDAMQGFLFSAPLPPKEMEKLLYSSR